jgi:hypothetical protein
MKGNSYMDHEPAPLSDMKVLEGKLVTKFLNTRFRRNFW